MLTHLKIRNFALVEDLELDFGPGFNAVTGETGAGKSLLIGALQLLLGERADKQIVRNGTSEAVIEAEFAIGSGDGVDALLEEAGLDVCEDNRLLLRRIVPRNSAGRNFINDGSATLAVFKRLGERLVDLHGPHEHQSLFSEGPRIAMLDAFGGCQNECDEYACAYHDLAQLLERRAEIAGMDDSAAERMELLEFQVRELDDAGLDVAEEDALTAELETVANAQRIRELSAALNEALMGEGYSAFSALAGAQRMLSELERIYPAATDYGTEIRALTGQLQAIAENLTDGLDAVDDDPGRLDWLENRMALYFRLKRKHRCSVPELLQQLEKWRDRLDQWRGRDEELQRLDRRVSEGQTRLSGRGEALSRKRRAAAGSLAEAVTRQLADLGLAQGEFRVSVEPAPRPRANGMDCVEYSFTPNAGEPTAPLRAVASSGEISRVMLAAKAVLAAHDNIPVLVFDEIDANLGGEAGHAVGNKLKELAKHHQVIAITHLAQVAVRAHTHFAVSKQTSAGRTRTTVERLEAGKSRANELARMLGGEQSGAAALRHAESMLRQSGA